MSVRATPAAAVPAFTSAASSSSTPITATARAAVAVDSRHPNAHLLSSLMANATPAMAVRATAATAAPVAAVNGSGMHADMAQLQMNMAAYYQQMQVMMVNYMTAVQQQQQQQQQRQEVEQVVEAITHPTQQQQQQQQPARLSPTLAAKAVAQHAPSQQPVSASATFPGYTSISPTAAATAAQQMSAALAQMAAAAAGRSVTQEQQQQLMLMQHMQQQQHQLQQQQQQQQQQYQLMMANPALLAQFATPATATPLHTQPPHDQPQPTQPPPPSSTAATAKKPSSAVDSPAAVDSVVDSSSELSEEGAVRCVCGSFHRSGVLLACSGCGVLQHRSCIGRASNSGGKHGSGVTSEYYCELCEPTAPVHVGRELIMQRKEREWKAKLKGSTGTGSGNKRKRRRENGDGEGKNGVNEAEEAVAVDEDEEMKRLTDMFRAEIDTGLFESDTEKDDQQQQQQRHRSSEREQVKVEEELKEEISKAIRHVEKHKLTEHSSSSATVDSDNEERKEAPTARPLPLLARHHRTMTDSEKDAAAAISLLSPRPPLAPLTTTSTVRGSPSSSTSSTRGSPTRSRFVFPTDGLLAVSPHRSASSPTASASASAAFFSSASTTCAATSRLFDQLLRPSPFTSSAATARDGSGRGSLSVPSSPISGRSTSVLFSTRQAGLIGRSPRAVLISSNGDIASGGLMVGEKRAMRAGE